MQKIKLYLDFDGVILNTINRINEMLLELGLSEDLKKQKEFYKTIDWYELLRSTNEINDSFNNIKLLEESDLFDIEILTHVNSEQEGIEKINYLRNKLPNINVIITPIEIPKCDKVDPVNSILVDDYSKNLLLWREKGGIPIKFSTKNKIYEFITIDNLKKIIDLYIPILEIINNKKKYVLKKKN